MKKNLIKSFALACGLLASMGVYAQNSAATLDGLQVGQTFESNGVVYEVTNVTNTTDLTGNAECKIVGAVEGATAITLTSKNIIPETADKDVFVLTGELTNQFATNEDLEEITVLDTTPLEIPNDAFAASVYQNGYLFIPAGTFKAYTSATGWFNFLAKKAADDVILGEATGDGVVDLDDVAAIFELADAYVMEGEDDYKEEYDANGDGVIDLDDVSFIFAIADQYPWF